MSTITITPGIRPAARTAPRRSTAPSGSVRLTRRGRLVVFLFACAVVASVAVWLAAGSAATREDGGAPAVEVVTVAPGETLWDIASDTAAVTGDGVRETMTQIRQLNALDGALVYAGQQLRVPSVVE